MDLCNNTIATLACNKEDKVNSLAPIMTCVLLMASLTSVTVKRNLKEKKKLYFYCFTNAYNSVYSLGVMLHSHTAPQRQGNQKYWIAAIFNAFCLSNLLPIE